MQPLENDVTIRAVVIAETVIDFQSWHTIRQRFKKLIKKTTDYTTFKLQTASRLATDTK